MTTAPHPAAALATRAVHGGASDHAADGPVVAPLFQSVNFLHPAGSTDQLRYPRYGTNPTAESLQRRLAALEGAEAALVLGSGMGATACAMLALLRPGDHLVSSSWVYGGTHQLFTTELPSMGIEVTFVDPTETRKWRRAVRNETRGIFLESPVNPTCRVVDLRPASYLAREMGLALVVDSTFASPMNLRPIEHGADVVIHSATKYLNGHHDVIAGVVLGTASFVEEVRRKMMVWGQAPDPFACWLLERGIKTLAVRVRQHNENAMAVAAWCAERPEIRRVHYPGLPDHADHAVASELLDGFGGMMAIELEDGEAADRFMSRLRLILPAPSLGGVDSLASQPRFTSHVHLTAAERSRAGIPDGFVRLSIGIEDADDLIADIAQALAP
ncbi:MAG TPA: PLP-dependent aspartate aminotransferase family protein [Gemmatimonadaceae bacterium]|nr:PLP-dependent aspartate aminotransferase family protein [Gemmatimonadaceae bacterium]